MLCHNEKGAISHSTTGDGRVDYFYKSIRGLKEEQHHLYLNASWRQSKLDTVKLIHFIRDCRGKGKGEKQLCYAAYKWLMQEHPEVVQANFVHLPFYGCYKDWLHCFAGTGMEETMLTQLAKQLSEDWATILKPDKPIGISLAWKWAPTEGCSFDKKHQLVTKLCRLLQINKKEYRHRCTIGRYILNVVEQLMCAKKWENIDFSKVSSNAMHRYKSAFKKHQADRWASYLQKVQKGEAKMNVQQLMPHEIVGQYLDQGGIKPQLKPEVETQWIAYMRYLVDKVKWGKNTLVVADLSGSMFFEDSMPAKVCLSLTLTAAHLMPGRFHNMCIPFSRTAKFHRIEGDSLADQLSSLMKAAEVANTDLQAVFDEILKTYQLWEIAPDQEVETLLIVTDGQWDQMTNNGSATHLEAARAKFSEAGRKCPNIIFWNVRSNTVDFPASQHETGVALVSGFSADLMRLLVDGEDLTPLNMVKKALSAERYDRLTIPE